MAVLTTESLLKDADPSEDTKNGDGRDAGAEAEATQVKEAVKQNKPPRAPKGKKPAATSASAEDGVDNDTEAHHGVSSDDGGRKKRASYKRISKPLLSSIIPQGSDDAAGGSDGSVKADLKEAKQKKERRKQPAAAQDPKKRSAGISSEGSGDGEDDAAGGSDGAAKADKNETKQKKEGHKQPGAARDPQKRSAGISSEGTEDDRVAGIKGEAPVEMKKAMKGEKKPAAIRYPSSEGGSEIEDSREEEVQQKRGQEKRKVFKAPKPLKSASRSSSQAGDGDVAAATAAAEAGGAAGSPDTDHNGGLNMQNWEMYDEDTNGNKYPPFGGGGYGGGGGGEAGAGLQLHTVLANFVNKTAGVMDLSKAEYQTLLIDVEAAIVGSVVSDPSGALAQYAVYTFRYLYYTGLHVRGLPTSYSVLGDTVERIYWRAVPRTTVTISGAINGAPAQNPYATVPGGRSYVCGIRPLTPFMPAATTKAVEMQVFLFRDDCFLMTTNANVEYDLEALWVHDDQVSKDMDTLYRVAVQLGRPSAACKPVMLLWLSSAPPAPTAKKETKKAPVQTPGEKQDSTKPVTDRDVRAEQRSLRGRS